MEDTENWLPVVVYEGYYEVSDLGNVRSVDREITVVNSRGWSYKQVLPGRALKINMSPKAEYPTVGLCRDGKSRTTAVHQVVARAFLGEPGPGQEVLHGPGRNLDNRLVNLRYGTRSENMLDKHRDGTFVNHGVKGEAHWKAKMTAGDVREIRSLWESTKHLGKTDPQKWTLVKLADRFGYSMWAIRSAVTRKSWAHID